MEIDPNIISKLEISENLIKVAKYEEARRYALESLNEILSPADRSISTFLMFSSYLLHGDISKSSKELETFLDYCRSTNQGITIEETQWTFKGLINFIG